MRILDTLIIAFISVLFLVIALVGGLLTIVGVQCLNSTTHTTAILSIGTGVLLIGLAMFCFPWAQWSIILWDLHGWWNRYTNRVTEESQDLPVISTGYDTVKAEPKMYTQEEMEDAIYAAKDQVANHWSKECIRLALELADERKNLEFLKSLRADDIRDLKRQKSNADFWKAQYEGMKSLNACVEKRADLAQNNELRAQRKLTIASIKVEMAELRLDLVKPEVKEKIQKEFGRISDLLKDASIKVDGNCPEQRASFLSIIKCARAIMDGIHVMWIKNHI